jgi:hypothetical protein
MKSKTSSSGTDAVETAVPLIQKNDYDSSRTEQTPETKKQADYMPVIHFFSPGICIGMGMVFSGIMYGSIEIVLNQYGENPTLQGALAHVVYGFLGLVSFAVVCVVFAFHFTKNGSKHIQRLLNENTHDFWDARSVFLGVVFFEGGFLLGSNLMRFAFESIMLGVPPSYLQFTFDMILELFLLVCYFLIGCYYWGIDDVEEGNDESEAPKEDLYIAIV